MFLKGHLGGKKGYSLIELSVYSLIIGTVFLVIGQLYHQVQNFKKESQASLSFYEDSNRIFWDLYQTIHLANKVDLPLRTQSANQLILNNGLTTYTLDQGNMIKTNNGQSYQLNSQDSQLVSLNFTHLSPAQEATPSLKINYTIVSKDVLFGGRQLGSSYQTTVSLRNQ